MVLKWIVLVLAVVIAWHFVNIWKAGRTLAKIRTPGGSLVQNNDYKYTLSRHRSMVACVSCLIVLAVILIETMVRMSPDPYTVGKALMVFHLGVVTASTLIFVSIALWFTGVRSPQWHGTLAYAFFTLFTITAASGMMMLYQLPQ